MTTTPRVMCLAVMESGAIGQALIRGMLSIASRAGCIRRLRTGVNVSGSPKLTFQMPGSTASTLAVSCGSCFTCFAWAARPAAGAAAPARKVLRFMHLYRITVRPLCFTAGCPGKCLCRFADEGVWTGACDSHRKIGAEEIVAGVR